VRTGTPARLGAAAGGVLGQFLGPRAVFVSMALRSLTMLAGMAIVTDARTDATERDAGPLLRSLLPCEEERS
jgi:predicted MFS family arabinose efflux permease